MSIGSLFFGNVLFGVSVLMLEYYYGVFDKDLDVYKVNLNDELEFTSYADYELWKNEK